MISGNDDVEISLSHELAREWREYERASTAVMNSYIGPITNRYLKSLESQLYNEGYKDPLYIMQSNGGVIRAKTAITISNLSALLSLLKNLPLAYNKDMQEDKKLTFETFDNIFLSLKVLK